MTALGKRHMRVLILADVCNPDWPSLPVVGFNYARALAEQAEVHLVTQVRNRDAIERVGLGGAPVTYIDTERIAAPMHKLARVLRRGSEVAWTIQMALDYPSYIAFELQVWREFRSALQQGGYDIVHRITPMSPTLPSAMARRCPVPFVLGPLNGNLPWPRAFLDEQAREREGLSRFRSAYKLLPFYRSTYTKPRAILAAFPHTMADIPAFARARAIDFPEVGVDPALFRKPERACTQPLTVLYAGRLVPYKLPDVPVLAFAESPLLREHKLVVLGDGPELTTVRRIVAEKGLGGCVQLLGRRSQAEVAEWMQRANIFAFPSIRELGAGVVVEAMASGMANVVIDYGGPGALIDSDRGVKLPLGAKSELVASMRRALEELVTDPARVRKLGERAHRYVMEHFTWEAKAKKTLQVYDWVLGLRPEKPDFYAAPAVSS